MVGDTCTRSLFFRVHANHSFFCSTLCCLFQSYYPRSFIVISLATLIRKSCLFLFCITHIRNLYRLSSWLCAVDMFQLVTFYLLRCLLSKNKLLLAFKNSFIFGKFSQHRNLPKTKTRTTKALLNIQDRHCISYKNMYIYGYHELNLIDKKTGNMIKYSFNKKDL